MLLRPGLITAVVVGLAALSRGASADVLSMRAEAHGGGAGGLGVAGDRKDDAFQNNARGGAYGALVGIEFLFVDAWVQHHQYSDGSLIGTWTQFMAGLDVNLDIGGGEKLPGSKDPEAKTKPKGYVELGLGVGFGVGTNRQVDPPLDNSEVSDKGFLAEAHISAGAHLTQQISLGVTLPVTAGYYFMSDEGAANVTGTHYQAIEAALLVNFRLKLKIK
jgi:hypothetical protein